MIVTRARSQHGRDRPEQGSRRPPAAARTRELPVASASIPIPASERGTGSMSQQKGQRPSGASGKANGGAAPGGDPGPEVKLPDPVELSRTMGQIAERSQKLVAEFMRRQSEKPTMGMGDPLNIGQAFLDMTARLMANPAQLVQAQLGFWQDYMTLWQNTTKRMIGQAAQPVISPSAEDRRFKDAAWATATSSTTSSSPTCSPRATSGHGRSRSRGSSPRPRRRSISTRASSSTR
jgi:polyhydroxyalkanoate synthase subunit PhaC